MSVLDFGKHKMREMGAGACISCPCGMTHFMKLDEERTCPCGRVYGYTEEAKSLGFYFSGHLQGVP